MVPKIHKKGKSFRGAARYLLHDIDAKTAHRVAWTEVRNVSSRNAEVAWRVMAATAMDQDRLKQEAGVANTGRKSKDHVLHFSLAWHPEEAPNLNRQEMMRAVTTILHVMEAQEHQCLVVAHKDGAPHLHVLVNRVHPQNGKILSSSFEKLKASRWAQEYEKQRGKIYCEQRVINNEARDRDEYTRGEKDQARHIHDLNHAPANDNERKQELLDEHRRKATALKEAQRKQQARHNRAWQLLEATHRQRIKQLKDTTRQQILRSKTHIRERFRPLWESQFHEHQAALRVFEQRELRTLGRIQNVLKSIDFRGLIGRKPQEDGRVRTVSEMFQVISSTGARLQALERQHEVTKQALARQQKRDEQTAMRLRQAVLQKGLEENRRRYAAERASLILTQAMEQAKLKTQWMEKGRQMRQGLQKIQPSKTPDSLRKETLTHEFQAAAKGQETKPTERGTGDLPPTRSPAPKTNPHDLFPVNKAQEAAKQIDEWKAMRADRFNRPFGRGKNRDDEPDR